MNQRGVNFCKLAADQIEVGMTLLVTSVQVCGWGGSYPVPLQASVLSIQRFPTSFMFDTTAGPVFAQRDDEFHVEDDIGDRSATPMVYLDYNATTFQGFSID